jgi:hypothetical protein
MRHFHESEEDLGNGVAQVLALSLLLLSREWQRSAGDSAESTQSYMTALVEQTLIMLPLANYQMKSMWNIPKSNYPASYP